MGRDLRKKVDRALAPETLQWYLDYISGAINFKNRGEVLHTHDTILNMILADLLAHGHLPCADVYKDVMGLAKRIYFAKFPEPDLPDDRDIDDGFWAGGQR